MLNLSDVCLRKLEEGSPSSLQAKKPKYKQMNFDVQVNPAKQESSPPSSFSFPFFAYFVLFIK